MDKRPLLAIPIIMLAIGAVFAAPKPATAQTPTATGTPIANCTPLYEWDYSLGEHGGHMSRAAWNSYGDVYYSASEGGWISAGANGGLQAFMTDPSETSWASMDTTGLFVWIDWELLTPGDYHVLDPYVSKADWSGMISGFGYFPDSPPPMYPGPLPSAIINGIGFTSRVGTGEIVIRRIAILDSANCSTIDPTPTATPEITPTVTPTTTPDPTRVCLAPENGEFNTPAGWIFDRGSDWYSAGITNLPAADNGLVHTESPSTLPTAPAGGYLIMEFQSAASGSGGRIGAMAQNGLYDATSYFDVFPAYYTYQSDITPLGGGDSANLFFANAATGTVTSDVQVDNICIFTSSNPPVLPFPTGGGLINPVDLGFVFSSCADVDAIWAGLGVNMAQHRANYAAGVSFWDPMEWLSSAIWVTLGDWSCMFMAAFSSFMNALEYILNSLLNVFSWMGITVRSIVLWFAGWLTYGTNLIVSYFDLYGQWLNNASAWIGESLNNLSPYLGGVLNYVSGMMGAYWGPFYAAIGASLNNYSAWIGQILNTYSSWLGQWLNNASAWIGESLNNLSAWIGETLNNLSAWLGQWLNNLSAWIGESLNNLSAWIGETLNNLWAALKAFFGAYLAWLGAWLRAIFESLVNIAWFIVRSLGSYIDWIGSLLTFPGEIYNWIMSQINSLLIIIRELISGIFDWITTLWNEVVFPVLELIYQYLKGAFGEAGPMVLELLLAGINFAIAVVKWLIANVISIVTIPRTIYLSFQDGINSPAYTGAFECSNNGLWCFIFAGFDLMNQAIGPAVLYPVVIVGLTISTVVIFKREISEFGEFILDTVREL